MSNDLKNLENSIVYQNKEYNPSNEKQFNFSRSEWDVIQKMSNQ